MLDTEFYESRGLKPVYIYALIDPETDLIRYIGKSIRPFERLTNHMNEKSKCHRSHWIQSLKRRGLAPKLAILEQIIGNWPWQHSEKYWIAYGRKNGWPLTNNTSGGDGVPDLPEETRKKIAMAWTGRKHSPETAEKLRGYRLGTFQTDETKAKISAAHKGRKITWAHKIGLKKRKFNDEQILEILEKLANGAKVKDLAAEYGTHRTSISKIKKGKYCGQRNQ